MLSGMILVSKHSPVMEKQHGAVVFLFLEGLMTVLPCQELSRVDKTTSRRIYSLSCAPHIELVRVFLRGRAINDQEL